MIHRSLFSVALLVATAAAQTVLFPAGAAHVTLPFTENRNHIVIQVGVNGTDPQPAVLDTGAHGAVLNGDTTSIAKYRLQPGDAHGEVRGVGGNGARMQAVIDPDVRFDLGGASLTGNMVAVVDRPLAHGMPAFVVGQSIFSNFTVQVDYVKHEITLYDPARFKYSGKGAELPLEFDEHGLPYVTAKVTLADAKDLQVKLVLDTGASHPLSLQYGSLPEIKEPQGVEKRTIGRGASGEVLGYVTNSPSVTLAGFTLTDVPTTYPDSSLGRVLRNDANGNLGSGILRRFTVTYDYQHKRIFLEPNAEFGEPFKPLPPLPH